jgi:hypothetical protein
MANTDPKLIFAAPIPLDRVEVTVHKSLEDHPPVNMCQLACYGPFGADGHSQDNSLVLSICNDLDRGVKR